MKILIWLLLLPSASFAQSLVQYVDPLIGSASATTESVRKHGEAGSEMKGQTFPGVGRPFGMILRHRQVVEGGEMIFK